MSNRAEYPFLLNNQVFLLQQFLHECPPSTSLEHDPVGFMNLTHGRHLSLQILFKCLNVNHT